MTVPAWLKEWWHNPALSFWNQHPVAHANGGAVFFAGVLVGRAVWPHLTWPWRAALVASVAQLLWEAVQTEVTPGYSFWKSGVWDWLTATLVAAALAALT